MANPAAATVDPRHEPQSLGEVVSLQAMGPSAPPVSQPATNDFVPHAAPTGLVAADEQPIASASPTSAPRPTTPVQPESSMPVMAGSFATPHTSPSKNGPVTPRQ
jgi:hypothetical protein